jgi:hypothetical protein
VRQAGFAGSSRLCEVRAGFREAADSFDLVKEGTGAKKGAVGPANQVAHAVGMGQKERLERTGGRGSLPYAKLKAHIPEV